MRGKAGIPLFEALKKIDPKVKDEFQFDWLFLPKSNERTVIEDKIIKSNTNIPMILVDENGNIGADSYLNLDPEKAKDPAYLQEQLEIMKEQNNPIEIDFAKNRTQLTAQQCKPDNTKQMSTRAAPGIGPGPLGL